jgi:biopolymer transport protein ExbD
LSLRHPGGGLRPHRRGARQAAVELTPLIDIVFQLLIFFLLTATFQNNPSFRVKLPKAKNTDVTQEPKAVVVTIGADGVIEVDGKPVDMRELQMRLCTAAEDDSTTGVNIKADEATQHQYVVQVMDIAKECGLERLGILHGR